MAPKYKVRLIFGASRRGILNWKVASHTWRLPNANTAVLRARDAESLAEATEFHIEICGFADRIAADKAGEKLRSALRLANAVLGLGLHVPLPEAEIPRARLAPHVKEKIADEHGVAIVDCVFGLNVLKEGEEFELVSKASASSRPQSSDYVLEAVSLLWEQTDALDARSNLACELLNASSRESSRRSAFLIAFLAFDVLMERRDRSEEAQRMIRLLREFVDSSELAPTDKNHLHGYLGGWKQTSLKAEIERFVALGSNAEHEIQGERLPNFLGACSKLRNKIAHPPKDASATIPTDEELIRRTQGLCEVARSIVWARNDLPKFTVYRPSDVIQIDEMKLTVL